MKTKNNEQVEIITKSKPGMSIFMVFGLKDGLPCHWTKEGKYRMDDKDSIHDIMNYNG